IQDNPGEIQSAVIAKLSSTLASLLADKQLIADTFGKLMTQPKNDIQFYENDSQNGDTYRLGANVRCAWFGSEDIVSLYINGEVFQCSRELARKLSNRDSLDGLALSKNEEIFLKKLKEFGLLEK